MKLGVKLIIAGAVTFLIGAVVIPLLVVFTFILHNGHGDQFEVPGTTEISVLTSGRYYLWNDFRTVYKGKSYSRSESVPDGAEIRVHEENGAVLPFTSNSSISEQAGNDSRNSIGYVDVGRPGKLVIEISGNYEKRIFSFSQSRFLKIFIVIVMTFGFSILAGIAGFGLICWGFAKLARAKKSALNGPITLGGLTSPSA